VRGSSACAPLQVVEASRRGGGTAVPSFESVLRNLIPRDQAREDRDRSFRPARGVVNNAASWARLIFATDESGRFECGGPSSGSFDVTRFYVSHPRRGLSASRMFPARSCTSLARADRHFGSTYGRRKLGSSSLSNRSRSARAGPLQHTRSNSSSRSLGPADRQRHLPTENRSRKRARRRIKADGPKNIAPICPICFHPQGTSRAIFGARMNELFAVQPQSPLRSVHTPDAKCWTPQSRSRTRMPALKGSFYKPTLAPTEPLTSTPPSATLRIVSADISLGSRVRIPSSRIGLLPRSSWLSCPEIALLLPDCRPMCPPTQSWEET